MKKCILIALYVMSFCEAADHQPRAGRLPRGIGKDKKARENWNELVQKGPTNFTNKIKIDFSRKSIKAIPEKLDDELDLSSLISLSLEHNEITNFPETIQGVPNLQMLYLEYNQITNLPKTIQGLLNLRGLDLRHNKITNFPKTIQGLPNLRELDLRHNKITNFPKTIQGLQKLQVLYLEYNEITNLPDTIEGLPNLRQLYLRHNPIAPKTLPNGEIVPAEEQIIKFQNNINATREATQPQLQILF